MRRQNEEKKQTTAVLGIIGLLAVQGGSIEPKQQNS